MTYVEIYNEKVKDLLSWDDLVPNGGIGQSSAIRPLKVREHPLLGKS